MKSIVAEKQENENVSDVLTTLCREGAKKMLAAALEAEVAEFIAKYSNLKDEDGHQAVVRNGYHPERTIQTGIGDIPIRQPRIDDRVLGKKGEQRFTSGILPKFMRKSPSLQEVIPVLYLQGISTNKFSIALEALLGKDAKGLSSSTITRMKEGWLQEYDEWTQRSLKDKEYVYVWADGIYCKARLDAEKQCLLVIIGVTADGTKELIAVQDGFRESEASWLEMLKDIQKRGLSKPPKLATCDGAMGFQNAVDKIWGELKIQRCWFHKSGNILDKLPDCVQSKALKMIHNMYLADTRENALEAYDLFIETFEKKYPKATECLSKDKEDLFRFYDFPAKHWVHIRTTNPIESTFATVRLRHRSTKGNGSTKATLAMVFKLCQEAEKRWRRLKGFELLKLVINNKTFVNGELVEKVA
jgi:transposase-like protein